jgi:hypothetical protein
MPRAGFEPMIPVFERTKTANALDRSTTVIGLQFRLCAEIKKETYLKIFFSFKN